MLGGGPTVLGKDGQLHPLMPHLKNPLPMVVWVTGVVYLYKYHHLFHWLPILDFTGGSKWEQMHPPRQTKNVDWVLV
jgi:hypothetical protein